MHVTCNHCGKNYRINSAFVTDKGAWFRCKGCGEPITVAGTAAVEAMSAAAPPADDPTPVPAPAAKARNGGVGLRTKMTALFLIVPLALMIGAGVFYLQQLHSLSGLIAQRSSQAVTELAEKIIADKAQSVARQVQMYLDAHPGLTGPQLNRRADFRAIALQPVGTTGYTALYELPDAAGVWRTWVHVNPKIIGIDMKRLAKPLGKNFPGFWRVFAGVSATKEAHGYYTWQDRDGVLRDKFMVSVPVPGTRYAVASTTYLDEFTKPIHALQAQVGTITGRTNRFTLGALGATIVLIGLIVTSYGYRLTRQIRSLTDHAERISVGDLDSQLAIKSNDEIGELAEAISLMQTSIRMSIDRLRRR